MIDWLTSWAGLLDLGWLLFLLFIFNYFWKDRQALIQTKNWIKTQGKVIAMEWTQEKHRAWPEIEYSYQVNDREYRGHYLFLDTSHNNPNSLYARRIAYKAAMSYEKSQELTVYFNPVKPEQSALDITMPRKLNLVILVVSGLIILHVGVILFRIMY